MSLKAKTKSSKKRTHSQSESGSDSEHELFHYHNDRVQLMKEVIKILKLKKIKALAPPAIKKMDMEEINTLLLEELLGISNKRLKKIFEGQNADDESSSSDEDKIDVISLDSISDDEICFIDETKDDPKQKKERAAKCRRKKHKIKKENDPEVSVKTEIKSEKDKDKANKEKSENTSKGTPGLENDKLLSVLELLELQARARAIRSQLALEAENKAKEAAEKAAKEVQNLDDSDEDDAVIIETPEVNEIVISSSDDEENENGKKGRESSESQNNVGAVDAIANKIVCKQNGAVEETKGTNEENEVKTLGVTTNEGNKTSVEEITELISEETKKPQKIKLIRNILVEPSTSGDKPSAEVNLTEIPLPEGDKDDNIDKGANKSDEFHEVPKGNDNNEHNCENLTADDVKTVEDAKKVGKNVPEISAHEQDDEDDVIRLDIVEIDGIDD